MRAEKSPKRVDFFTLKLETFFPSKNDSSNTNQTQKSTF